MYTFLVLGLIPGTNIQIGFWAWLIIMIAFLLTFRKTKPYVTQHIGNWWHQFDDIEEPGQRKPLHASRLHLRGL
ncbi:MAG TPA: hypothetical protein VHB72_03205 [Candidatus Saccharimonadales bacterium]|nr:hypothetical protein [Candidatus Saccharimonadales bacterium]